MRLALILLSLTTAYAGYELSRTQEELRWYRSRYFLAVEALEVVFKSNQRLEAALDACEQSKGNLP